MYLGEVKLRRDGSLVDDGVVLVADDNEEQCREVV
jgi:hypothetical protein